MKFSDMEMKELGRSTWNDTHNITSLIRTPQVCLRHLADGRSLHGGRVQTHTHTYTHTHRPGNITFKSLWKMSLETNGKLYGEYNL